MIDYRERLSRLSEGQLQSLANQLFVNEEGRTQLVAFVVAGRAVSDQDLRSHCKEHLPDYMLPHRFERVDALPLTATGKIDRRQLQYPVLERTPVAHASSSDGHMQPLAGEGSDSVSADSATYQSIVGRLTEVWSEVLQMEGILPDDDYFELGGDSIANLQIIARCASHDLHFGPADLLQNPTIDLLARWLLQTTLASVDSDSTEATSAEPSNSNSQDNSVDETKKSEVLRVLNLGRDN